MNRLSREDRAALEREVVNSVRASQLASDLIDESVCAHLGINPTDGRGLDILERRQPMAAGELAEAMALSTGAVTTLLDRLEAAGYARRVRDTRDRRRVLVELTPKSERVATDLYGPLAQDVAILMAGFTEAELVRIRDFLEAGTDLSRRHAARIRALDAGAKETSGPGDRKTR